MAQWEKILKEPFVTVILGDVREGKTTTMASIMDFYRKEKEIYMIGKKKTIKKWPEWVRQVNPDNISRIPSHTLTCADDAHLYYYARDWVTGGATILDKFARERGHMDMSFIYTTQQGRVLDINLLSIASTLIFKRPSQLQLRMERPELKKMFEEADKALKEEGYAIEQAYVIGNKFRGTVEIEKPQWFTDEMSKAYSDYFKVQAKDTRNRKVLKGSASFLKMIGRLRG